LYLLTATERFVVALFADHTEPAFVTHIRNPCHFVVQLNRNIDQLTELSHAINSYCKNVASQNDIPRNVEPGIGSKTNAYSTYIAPRIAAAVALCDTGRAGIQPRPQPPSLWLLTLACSCM